MAELIRHPDWPQLPLGRKLRPDHDPRNRAFVTRWAEQPQPLRSRTHRHYGPALDQRRVGSCTGNAAAQALNTHPLHRAGTLLFTERDAAVFYSENTQRDHYPGTWYFDRIDPHSGEVLGHGDDTGSDGQAAAQTLLARGLITRYEHAFGLQQALATLPNTCVITGVPWYEGMFAPDPQGYVSISGQVAGGHEFLVRGIDVRTRSVLATNSWGTDWGLRGSFRMTWDTWGRLLDEQGDVTVLYR